MKMGEYHCENHLEIYGKWEDLKTFTINNWGNQGLSFRKSADVEQPCMIEYEKDVFNREMDMIYYKKFYYLVNIDYILIYDLLTFGLFFV